MAKKHTYDLGVIGNCAFMAHIDRSADVRWLCWPRFDSSFIFGSLLDSKKGGRFSVCTGGETANKQYYLENTNILVTEFGNGTGGFRVTDFAPRFYEYERFYKPLMLVRKIEPLSGNPKVKISCDPVGNYGDIRPEKQLGSNHIRYSGLEKQVRLTTNIPLNFVIEERAFVLNEPKYLVLTWGIPLEAPLEATAEEFLRRTTLYWQEWVKNCTIGEFYQKEVIRSALALKIHQFEDTGAIIASGTTSLPEFPGSQRTWDYRYCWLRDAYYTLTALANIGHFKESEQFAHFIENIATNEQGRYGPVYSLTADQNFSEKKTWARGLPGKSTCANRKSS